MNIVLNPSFQTGDFTNWSPGTGVSVVPGGVPIGAPPYYCTQILAIGSGFAFCGQYFMPASPSTTYYFSMWAKRDLPSSDFINIIVYGTYNYIDEILQPDPAAGWTFYSYTITTDPNDSDLSIHFSGKPLPAGPVYVDSFWLSTTAVCYPESTQIKVFDTTDLQIKDLPVSKLSTQTHHAVTTSGSHVPILKVVRCGTVERLFLFEKDVVSPGIPSQPLLLTSGHKLPFNGSEIKASEHPLSTRKKCKKTFVYTLVLPEHDHIYAFDQPIVAFGLEEWEKIADNSVHTEIRR